MRIWSLIICFFCVVSCTGTNLTAYRYTPPNTLAGRLCTNQCDAVRDYCGQSCAFQQRQCVAPIQAHALLAYDQYTRNQFANHLPITLKAGDFENTDDCKKVYSECMNDCGAPYQSCYKGCGGMVTSAPSCSFLCF